MIQYNHTSIQHSLPFKYLQIIITQLMQRPTSLLIITLFLLLISTFPFTFKQLSITSTISTISTASSYTFTFNRAQSNNFGITNWDTIPVNATDTLTVTFPLAYTITGSVQCTSITVDGVSITNFTCGTTATTVTFSGAFASLTGSSVYVNTTVVVIGNVMNPSPAITISGFSGTIGSDVSGTGTDTVTLTAGYFSSCSITFTPTTVNSASSTMIISLTPTNTLTVTSTLRIQFPLSYWTNDISATALPITSTMSCSNYSSNIKTGITCAGSAGTLITASNIFNGDINSNFALGVLNFLSPPSNQPSDLITITSYQGSSRVDTCTVYPSGLTPASFTNFSVVAQSTMTVNSYVALRFDFNLMATISVNDYFQIIFPTGTTFTYSSPILGTASYNNNPTVSGQTILIRHSSAISSTQTYSGTYTLVIQQFLAPPSTIPTGSITFSVLRNSYPIMTGLGTITAVAAGLSATVTATITTVLANTSYTFSIPLTQPLSSSGMIRITMPSQVTISTTAINCASLTGTGVSSAPTCTFSGNSILFSNINSSSSIISANQTLTLTVNGVINPSDTSRSSTFDITTFYSSSTSGLTQSGTAPGITATIGSIALATASVTPSSYKVLQSTVSYTIAFNNTYTIPQGGFVELQIPTDVTITIALASLNNTYTKYNINGGIFLSGASSSSLNTGYYQINYTNIAQSGAIAAGSRIELRVETVCKNPSNTRIVSPFAITTYSSTSAIETLTGLTVQMTTPAAFYLFTATRASSQNSAITSYTITLRQEVALPAGTLLFLTLPSQVSMNGNSTCIDLSANALTCTQTSLQDLTVTLPVVAAGTDFGVVISNVNNPASYRPIASNFTATTKTADQISIYANSTITPTLINSQPSNFTNVAFSFANMIYGNAQSLTLTVTPSTKIAPTYVLVALAPSLTIGSLSCNTFVGFTGSCTNVGSTVNVTGMTGTSQLAFTITGFTAPTAPATDYTTLSSFQNSFMVDQNSSFIQFTVTCPLPCRTCQAGNTTACLTCYNNTSIGTEKYYYSSNLSCLSACPSGFYDPGTLICVACSSPCLECYGLASNCTKCNTSSVNPVLNITNSTGQCQSCPTAYYLEVSVSQCVPCNTVTYFCSTCTTLTTCTTCVPGRFLLGTSCVTTCTADYYISNNGSWTCDSCNISCRTCLGTVSNCSSCSSGSYLLNGACQTTCPSPLVPDNGTNTCISCHSSCKACSSLSTNCTTCYTNNTLPYLQTAISNSTTTGSCRANCPQYYYGDLVNGVCVLCSTLGIGCADCASQTTCNVCDGGYVLYQNTCGLTAPAGYYDKNGVATACSGTCATCSILATNCTSCLGSLSLSSNQCVSTCPGGQVAISNQCLNCTSPCLNCSTSQTYCTACVSIVSPNTVYLTNGQCVVASLCPNYTYANPATLKCQACTTSSHCQTCTSAESCLTCVNGYFFSLILNNTCVVAANCPSGTVPIDRTCLACTSPCSTCSGSTIHCLSCVNSTYLYNTTSPTCVATCPAPLLMNNNSQSCTGCDSTCVSCSLYATNCTSCASNLYLQGNACQSNCDVGYYQLGGVCQPCPGNCSACVSNVACTACTNSTYLYISTCVSVCPTSRPIVDISGVCSTCTDVYCSQCDSNNYCSQCYFPRLLVQGTCQTSCPTDYVLDGNGTTCVYSPGSSGGGGTLTQSLTAASTFPVPFTVAAGFIAIACLMSKFQHSGTFLYGALYALWGLLQWAALCFLLVYYYLIGKNTARLSYMLILGGLGGLYVFNVIFFPIQHISVKDDKRLKSWLAGTFNNCWYWSSTLVGVIATNKFKNIIFCKLFNFTVFSARLANTHSLRSFYAFGFFAFLPALAVLAGTGMLVSETVVAYDQLFMAELDVLILTTLVLILALCHTSKPEDYFQDTDQDGLKINKRVQSFDEYLNEHIAPSVYQNQQKSHLDYHESARKINMVGNTLSLSEDLMSSNSVRDISIQAQQILGQRSFISRLNTEQISQFSMFEHKNRDISIQMDQHKEMIDMSVGQELMVKDVSISPASIVQNEVSVQYTNNQKQISVQMDRPGQEQVSIQMDRPGQNQISVQLSQPQQHEISIQQVPLYVDQTVHMTKDQAQLAIQCNAENQEVSIQYSAKPLIEHLDEDLPSEVSLQYTRMVQEPTDLSIQRRMLQGTVMPQQQGLKAELELDIEEKLQRKKHQLEQMQKQRWERQKQQARRNFQQKVLKKEEEPPAKQNHIKLGQNFNAIFNNQSEDMPSSLMHTEQMIEVNLPPRPPRPTTARTERQLINMLSGQQHDFSKRTDRVHNYSRQSSKQQAFRGKIKIEHGNVLMEEQPDMSEQLQDTFQQQELAGHNTMQQFPSVEKSRSTANITGKLTRKNDNILEDSEEEAERQRKQESINMHPLQGHRHRNYREEEVDLPKKTNLNKFLQNRRGNLISANYAPKNRQVEEEDDALTRQIQRPLAPQRSQQLLRSSNKKQSVKNLKNDEFEFDNNDRVYIPDYDQPIEEDALEKQTKKALPRRKSQKKLPERDQLLERSRKNSQSKSYMRETFNSKEKNRSLQKIYLNKLPRK